MNGHPDNNTYPPCLPGAIVHTTQKRLAVGLCPKVFKTTLEAQNAKLRSSPTAQAHNIIPKHHDNNQNGKKTKAHIVKDSNKMSKKRTERTN
eukprot:482967-Amphidinium_carterae.1